MTTETVKKRGRWKPGESGNPAGRSKNSGKLGALREALIAQTPEILRKLIEQAKNGDVASAKLILERAIPILRPEAMPVPLALTGSTLSAQGRALLAAVSNGDVSVENAREAMAALQALSKIIEVDELQRRIEILEAVQSRRRA
jgi:hypothetical protein